MGLPCNPGTLEADGRNRSSKSFLATWQVAVETRIRERKQKYQKHKENDKMAESVEKKG